MQSLTIKRLHSGGLITNYYCSSKCKHCLYGCSPKWPKQYIDPGTALYNFQKLIFLGCHSIHIGGGEPFLKTEALEKVLNAANQADIHIDYIETNSSWYKSRQQAVDILAKIKSYRVNTILISISPFHNEHIAFKKVKGVSETCLESGVAAFPWIKDFYNEIDAFDDNKNHSLEEYKQQYGSNYVARIPGRYWIHYGGRALLTYKDIYEQQSTAEIIKASKGCQELTDTSHFHVDLFANYVPGLCNGLAIKVKDLGLPLNENDYPILTILYNEGVKGLLRFAENKYGYSSEETYLSKCHLCLDIRSFLVQKHSLDSIELQPVEYYHQIH